MSSFSLLALSWAYIIQMVIGVDPLIDLGYSQYKGTAQSNGVSSWLGIRFAAPPVGNRRFRAPQPPLWNDGIQIANQHGLLCLATSDYPDAGTAEDCLFLDVYAPSNATSTSNLPVYFWIQGGGFNKNANANYPGDGLILASGMNMVVVTFNYRVSLYGFLASSEVVRDGHLNVGLLDQRLALEWVQKYIGLFGGNPNHVTVGGASSGATSIALLLTAFGGRDDGLFHATAAESQSLPTMLTVSESQYQYDSLVQRVGCGDVEDSLACLRRVNATYLQQNNIPVPYPGVAGNVTAPRSMYGPVIDGGLVPDYTDRLFRESKFIKVPVIFGDDSNEGTHFPPTNTSTLAEMNLFLEENYPRLNATALGVIDALYPVSEQFNDTGLYFTATADAFGEMTLICPGILISTASNTYSKQGNWNYRYNVLDPEQVAEGLGVSHTVEIPAIWGPEWVNGFASYNTTNAAIVPVMQGYWTSFIRSYDPNIYRASGSPTWEQFTDSKARILLQTNATAMETVPQDQQARCQYLESLELMRASRKN